MIVLLVIVIILAALGILGAVVEGLLWLTFVAALAFVIAVAITWSKLIAPRLR